MDDPYRIRPEHGVDSTAPPVSPAEGAPVRHTGSAAPTPPAGGAPGDRVTGLLWGVLAVLVALNAVVSVARPDNPLLSLAFGLPAAGVVVLLVVRYLGRRRA